MNQHANQRSAWVATTGRKRSGFTLVEILVTFSIVALVMTLLMPALRSVRDQAKSLECCSRMRTIAMEFSFFAQGNAIGGRGDSEALGRNRFRIDDFQESLYGLDEFWDLGSDHQGKIDARDSFMICPAAAASLTKTRGLPCSSAALAPVEDISLALNMRLRRSSTIFQGRRVLAPVASSYVPASIMDHPSIPLVMDVNAKEAQERNFEPFYIAPPLKGSNDPYADGKFWTPSRRHNGRTWVGFTGGHVLSSETPEREAWDWAYQADILR